MTCGFEWSQEIARWVQRVVLLPACEVQHYLTMQPVSWDLVRDHLFRSWQDFAERLSHKLSCDLCGLGLRGNVFIHVCEIGSGHIDLTLCLDCSRAFPLPLIACEPKKTRPRRSDLHASLLRARQRLLSSASNGRSTKLICAEYYVNCAPGG